MKAAGTPANESARIGALRDLEVLDTAPEPRFDDLTRLAAHVLDVPIALISLVDVERQWFKSRYGLDVPETPRDVSFCAHVVVRGSVLVVQDARQDDRFEDNPLVLADPHIRFYAGAPIFTRRGEVLGTLCAIDRRPRDPSPRQIEMLEALARQVASQLELRRLLLEHEKIEASKDEFLAIASHELRSPLTSIHGSLRLLQSGGIGEFGPDGWELLRIAGSNSERLIRLIDDMLDLHKIEAGGARLALAEVAPEALVRRAAEDARGFAEPAAVALEVVSGTRRRLRGDPDRLQQVLTNLLSNAVRHSPRGASITIETRDREDRVRISVRDRGPGIARHDLSRIFGKFEQVGSSRSAATRGTGLGLAISKAIVEQHGGAIGVESAPDAGSTFWFEIPAWDAAGSRTAFSMHPFSSGSPAT